MPAEQILAINNDLSQMYMYPQNESWILRSVKLRSFMRSDTLLPPASVAHDTFEPPVPWKLRMEKLWKDVTDGWTKVAHRKRLKRERIESERVRADQVAKAVQLLTLPQIFLVLTMYSARGWPYLVNFHMQRGPWNTHSFDVVPLPVHLGESREERQRGHRMVRRLDRRRRRHRALALECVALGGLVYCEKMRDIRREYDVQLS
jgi:hypothetical protein